MPLTIGPSPARSRLGPGRSFKSCPRQKPRRIGRPVRHTIPPSENRRISTFAAGRGRLATWTWVTKGCHLLSGAGCVTRRIVRPTWPSRRNSRAAAKRIGDFCGSGRHIAAKTRTMNASSNMKTASLETKGQAPAAAKKPYEAPVLSDWGTLEELTLANGNSGKNDGGRPPHSRTR